MPTVSDTIRFDEIIDTYMPRGAFYVVKGWQDYQFAGIIEENGLDDDDIQGLQERNEHGYDVFWTANAIKEELGSSSHKEENLNWINACYTDLDIPPEQDREEAKAKLAGHILFSNPQPSLVVETRAGYHLYWFTDVDGEEFKKIQQGVYEAWKPMMADPAAKNFLRLLRVPGFIVHKQGEQFKACVRMELCRRNDDGSFVFYPKEELLNLFPVKEAPNWVKKKKVKLRQKNRIFTNTYDIFDYVKSLSQDEVFQRCNGSALTGGEVFTMTQPRGGKIQIRKDGKPTPCWIDIKENAIFSNNSPGHYGIVEFAQWYGLDMHEIAKELKTIFPEYKPMQ